ncbi:unnamed protein product [Clavelina lepadiformis]|uniref:Choline/carnitine acyltransferase domain-containing protein n=1 Tax=Clavelina lepadiformis TaxID=159417 RepID=A0ABP0H2I2_CLALP
MASLFLVNDSNQPESKTFYNDSKLPSLPVPSVKQTIEKYLDSCEAVLTADEYEKTVKTCQLFMQNDAPYLQEKLLERATNHRNWLEQWWSDKVYLESRTSLLVSNFSGPGTYLEHYWPLQEGTQLERCAFGTYLFMQFWQLVRKEVLAAHSTSDGKYLTMHQFRYMFNTCRIPHKGRDKLHHSFRTEREGSSPTHTIVSYRGYLFKIECVDSKSGDIFTPPQFYKAFQYIRNLCESRAEGPALPALTSLDRDKWAEARDHLIEINPSNLEALREIESSLMFTAMDDTSLRNYTELAYAGMVGDPALLWYDKSYNSVTSLNGATWCNCDHTPYDAMVMVAMVEFFTYSIKKLKGVWPESLETDQFVKPIEINFYLDKKAQNSITEAKQHIYRMRQNLELLQIVFYKFGKSEMKKYKIHPDFMVQICLQLAYMQVHGKPGPTYETAITRQYYHGRTETCRTCTPEAVAFCKEMIACDSEIDAKSCRNLISLLQAAQSKFLSLMADCMNNHGCDRHLLGLLLISVENGLEVPKLFTDPAFSASGGNGNFVLSTSCVGYFHGQGGVAPMVEDGYGFFYRINDGRLIYTVSAYNSSSETSAQKMSDHFEYSMSTVYDLLKLSSRMSKM